MLAKFKILYNILSNGCYSLIINKQFQNMKKLTIFLISMLSFFGVVRAQGNVITDLNNLSNEKAYKIMGERGFIAGNDGYVMGSNNGPIYNQTFDSENPSHLFAILKSADKYYLYNVGAKMFAAKSGNKASLTPYPVHTIDIVSANVLSTDYDWIIKLNNKYVNLSNSSENGVYTEYDTEDGGNRWSITEITDYTPTEALSIIEMGLAQERQDLYEMCLKAEAKYNSMSDKTITQVVELKAAFEEANSIHASNLATNESISEAKESLTNAMINVDAIIHDLLFEFDLTKQKFRLKNASTNLYMTIVEKESNNQDAGGVQIKTEGTDQYFYIVTTDEENKYKIKSTDGAYLTSFSSWGYKATETEANACNHSLGYIGDGKYTIESPLGLVGSNNDATSDGSVMYSNHSTDKNNIYWILEPIYDAKIGENDYYATLADAVEAAEPGDEITLLADIDLTGKDWTPFGATPETAFQGTIDGNSKTITGLSGGTDKAGKVPFGLIAYATGNVTVKDLKMADVSINSGEYASAVMGLYIGAKGDDEATYAVNFENITVSGEIEGTDKPAAILGCTYSSDYTGKNKNITFNFTQCANNANISGTGRVGGIAGAISGQFAKDPGGNEIRIAFWNCSNSGVISSTSTTYKTGGIVGWMGSYGNYFFYCSKGSRGTADGELAGRFHFAGAIQNVVVPTTMLTYDLKPLSLYDNASEKKISVTWSWETNIGEVNKSRYTQTTYYVGNTLSDNEWRLTIDGIHYRAPFNVPLDYPHEFFPNYPLSLSEENVISGLENSEANIDIVAAESWTQDVWAYDAHFENQLPTAESCNVIGYVFEQTSETSYLYTKKSAGQYVSDVAKIGDNDYYTTLQGAISAATAGQTVTLLADVNASDIIEINKAITLDGNGKKLTSTAGRAINVSGADGVTIKNLTIEAKGERAINIIKNATNVTITGVTATAANYAVNAASSAPEAVISISGSTLTGLNVVNIASAGAQVTVDDCTLNCNDQSDAEGYAALCLGQEADGASISATDVTFNITCDEATPSHKAKCNVATGRITIGGSEDEVKKAVAVVEYLPGPYYYAFSSLQAAFDKAKEGETVKLVNDVVVDEAISVDKLVTLDFNEFNITRADGYDGYVFEVTGDLPMINGELGKNIEKGATCYIINDNDYKTEEGKTFALTEDQMVDIEYNRTFGHTDYQVLYVPFTIPFNNIKDDFDVYSITNISDVVELTQITDGTLEANVPYIIKAKEAGDKTIKVSYERLLSNPTEYTQVLGDYTITGTYTSKAIAAGEEYVLTNGLWCQLTEKAVTDGKNILGAFRVYLTANGENTPSEVRFVINNSDETAIDELKAEEGNNSKTAIYDLSGRRVEKAVKGIFVVNGKKVVK